MKRHSHFFYKPVIYTLCLLCFGLPVQGDEGKKSRGLKRATHQHALVVGINQYRHADGFYLTNLEGAVNDAQLLRDTLRHAQVNLPDRRVLLDAKATRAAFVRAWQDMLKQAEPGDTLILSFSGHGGQQSDTAPLDEKDSKDETLIFHDFAPWQPTQGRITDDELYGMFKEAHAYNIIFVVDACHSSGMVRSMKRPSGRFRNGGGFWHIEPYAPPSFPILPKRGDDSNKPLSHVTLITAVNSDSLKVPETTIDNKQHGALSWFFAKALTGEADGNRNGFLERSELARFLTEKVRDKMNNLQEPKLLPRADRQPVIKLPYKAPPQRPNIYHNVAIVVENISAPRGLKKVHFVNADQTFDLRFVGKGEYTEVFNNTGDKVTTLSSSALKPWQSLINKERLLKVLETQFDMRLKPIQITLREGDGLHKRGEELHFSIAPGNRWEGLKALTLFNLAGNGELQFLYPITEYGNPLYVRYFPYIPPRIEVTPPFGGDDLIAVLCEKPATGLHSLLKEGTQPNIPNPNMILFHLSNNRCQVGQYAFFSGK
ncbi:MAG TPA: caspase family protein [Thioploca sp.]|nr:caspase family protein [Thioploca sp.]